MEKKILHVGIPKGSLQDATVRIFEMAGFKMQVSSRSYFPSIDDDELAPVLIRAQEMSRYVEEGVFDCGITGNDWILENNSKVVKLGELMYSKATANPVRWVVAVHNDSKINSVKDLQGKRVSTELVNATRRYLKKNGVTAKVEFSWGATEVKVRAGFADAIVELTETGSSLRANNLREIATVCQSTTQFIANKDAWNNSWKRKKIEYIHMLLQGAIEARDKVGIKLNVEQKNLDRVLAVLPAMRRPTISSLIDEGWYALEVIIKETDVKKLIPQLKERGAEDIVEYPLNKIIH